MKSYREAMSASARSGESRLNRARLSMKMARALFQAGRYLEARNYAGEATMGYRSLGSAAGQKEATALYRELDAKIRPARADADRRRTSISRDRGGCFALKS